MPDVLLANLASCSIRASTDLFQQVTFSPGGSVLFTVPAKTMNGKWTPFGKSLIEFEEAGLSKPGVLLALDNGQTHLIGHGVPTLNVHIVVEAYIVLVENIATYEVYQKSLDK